MTTIAEFTTFKQNKLRNIHNIHRRITALFVICDNEEIWIGPGTEKKYFMQHVPSDYVGNIIICAFTKGCFAVNPETGLERLRRNGRGPRR